MNVVLSRVLATPADELDSIVDELAVPRSGEALTLPSTAWASWLSQAREATNRAELDQMGRRGSWWITGVDHRSGWTIILPDDDAQKPYASIMIADVDEYGQSLRRLVADVNSDTPLSGTLVELRDFVLSYGSFRDFDEYCRPTVEGGCLPITCTKQCHPYSTKGGRGPELHCICE